MNYLTKISVLFFVFSCFSQYLVSQDIQFESCTSFSYGIADDSDADNDGDVCEFKVVAQQTLVCTDINDCEGEIISWHIQIDEDDGIMIIEKK